MDSENPEPTGNQAEIRQMVDLNEEAKPANDDCNPPGEKSAKIETTVDGLAKVETTGDDGSKLDEEQTEKEEHSEIVVKPSDIEIPPTTDVPTNESQLNPEEVNSVATSKIPEVVTGAKAEPVELREKDDAQEVHQKDDKNGDAQEVHRKDEAEKDRWEREMDLMHDGVKKLFLNDFEGAETMFLKGMTLKLEKGGEGYDIRGSFALVHALVAVMRGVATFADDQLKECRERLREADTLASEEAVNWAGKKVTRGICTLCIGCLLILERSFVKGIYNILKSWSWIKSLQTEALEYEGREREVVRSAALFTLGSFYLLIGLLPPTLMRVASWLSGFPGDCKEGLEMIRVCWQERGLLAPWAALTYISFHVDTKTFLGEKLTEEEKAKCEQVIAWANEMFPGSLFFSGLAADFVAVTQRDTARARAMHLKGAQEMHKLPALVWVYNYKMGIYSLVEMDWFAAGTFFKTSMGVYIEAGRRSMVPFMAAYTLLCFVQCEKLGVEPEAVPGLIQEMFDLLAKYLAMPKKDWGRQDTWAFGVYGRYLKMKGKSQGLLSSISATLSGKNSSKVKENWPLLDLVEIMVLQVRCTWWMNQEQLRTLNECLVAELEVRKTVGSSCEDQEARAAMCQIDILRHLEDRTGALQVYSTVVDLESKVSKAEKQYGTLPMADYFAGMIYFDAGDIGATKNQLTKVKKYGNKYDLYQLIMLKTVVLFRLVGEELDQEFESLAVPAGSCSTLTININDVEEIPLVKWSWLVEKHTIKFSVTFRASAPGSETIVLQSFDRKVASEEATLGEVCLEELGPGMLTLKWDNSFSILRGKSVKYRLFPEGLDIKST